MNGVVCRWGWFVLCGVLMAAASCSQPTGSNGGGGGGTVNQPPDDGGGGQNVFGYVKLPAGSGGNLTSYKVISLRNEHIVGSDGSFAVFTHTSDFNPVWLLDEQGRPAFAGLLNTRTPTKNFLSANSTAVVLLFYALGGPMLPLEWRTALLESLADHPQTAKLTTAIEQAYAADRGTFLDPASPILAALDEAVKSVPQPSKGTVVQREQSRGFVEIQPTGRRGGVEVESKEAPNLTLTNTSQRNATYFLYRTGYETNDVSIPLNPPELVGSAPLPTSYQVNLEEERAWFEYWLGDLSEIEDNAELPGRATEVLKAEDDQLVVHYHLVVAGGHIPDEVTVPDWWTQSTNPDKQKWLDESQRLPELGLVKNAFLPAVFTMVFSFGQPLAQGLTSLEADAFVTEMEPYVDGLRAKIDAGEWDAAVRGLIGALAKSDTARSNFDARLNGWIGQNTSYSTDEFWDAIDGAEVYLKALAAGIKLTDVAGVLSSHQGAAMMDQWDVAYKNSKLDLRATDQTVDPSSNWTEIQAKLDGAPSKYCLRYRLTGPGCLVSAQQFSCEGSSNKEIKTTDTEVHYVIHEADIVEGTVVTITAELFESACDKVSGSARSTDSVQITQHEFPDPPPCDVSQFNLLWWQEKSNFGLKVNGTLGGTVTTTVLFGSAEPTSITILIPGGGRNIHTNQISVSGGGKKMQWSAEYLGTRYLDVRRDEAGMLVQIPGAMEISVSQADSTVVVTCPTNDLPFFKSACPFISADVHVEEQLSLWGPILGVYVHSIGTSMGLVGVPPR